MSETWKFETKSVHSGYAPDPTTKSVAVPLYQTVAYAFDSAQHGADLFDLKVPGNIYTRIMNPTTDGLEKRWMLMSGASVTESQIFQTGRECFCSRADGTFPA